MARKWFSLILALGLVFSLAAPVMAQDGDDDGEDATVNPYCTTADPQHPVGARIAETYGERYEQVMAWFCADGFGFGQIMLALQTSKTLAATDAGEQMTPGELLAAKEEMGGWGKVWQELKLIGKDKVQKEPKDKAPKMKDNGDDREDGDRPGKPDKPEKPGKPDKDDKPGKPDKDNKPGKPEKPWKSEKPDKAHESDPDV
jgi:hypothetical protein